MSRRNVLWTVSVTCISLLCWHAATSAPRDHNYELFRVFVDTLDQVEREYVRDIDREELFEGGLIGIMESLDLESSYLSPEVYRRARDRSAPTGDVGMQLTLRPSFIPLELGDNGATRRHVFVLGVLPGSPAEKAGILPGDLVVEIDDQRVTRRTLEETTQLLRGEPGTEVTLRLFRAGGSGGAEDDEPDVETPGQPEGAPREPLEEPTEGPGVLPISNDDGSTSVTLTRAKLDVPGLQGLRPNDDGTWNHWIEGRQGVAYVWLPALGDGIGAQLTDLIARLKEDDLKGLVLDLRFNPGGKLAEAIRVADLFLAEGRIASIEGPNIEGQHWDAKREGTLVDLPLTVLVNRFTAGPAEVVAASLKDHDRATVLGERTLGKGGVSRLIELDDARSALKLTVATYVRADGTSLLRRRDARRRDRWGVRPDDDMLVEQDPQALLEYFRWRGGRQQDNGVKFQGYKDEALARGAAIVARAGSDAASS